MIEEQIRTLKEKVSREVKNNKRDYKFGWRITKIKKRKRKYDDSFSDRIDERPLNNQQEEVNESLAQISLTKFLDSHTFDLDTSENLKPKEELSKEIVIDYNLLAEQRAPSPPLIKKDLSLLEKISLKRLRKKNGVIKVQKEDKPSKYVNLSVRIFYPLSRKLIYGETFSSLKRELVKANMQFIPENYVSVIFFTTLLSIFASIFLFVFFLFLT